MLGRWLGNADGTPISENAPPACRGYLLLTGLHRLRGLIGVIRAIEGTRMGGHGFDGWDGLGRIGA